MMEVDPMHARLQVHAQLDRMHEKSYDITLSHSQCLRICRQYHITGAELLVAIRQYCIERDFNLVEYVEEEAEFELVK